MSGQSNSLALDIERLEDSYDGLLARLARIETANKESFPFSVIERQCDGENPIRVWREYRGLSREQLAAGARIDPVLLAAFEDGSREPSFREMAAIGKVLKLDLELLLPVAQDDSGTR
jgi:DNA-binding XRE family transcriptional regulator